MDRARGVRVGRHQRTGALRPPRRESAFGGNTVVTCNEKETMVNGRPTLLVAADDLNSRPGPDAGPCLDRCVMGTAEG